MKKQFKGIIPPAITVFNNQGEIDKENTKRFFQHLINEGVHGLFIAGSTGEASLMDMEQRKLIIDIGVEAVKGRVPLFAGTGHNSTRITTELSKYAENSGVDAVIVHCPHYPKPTQETIYQHFKTVADEIGIPVLAYNWPEQYGVDMEPKTVARLAKDGYICGIKDTHINIDHTAEIIRLSKGEIAVFTGSETKIFPSLCLGADGSIPTISNIIPSEILGIYYSFQQGNIAESRKRQLAISGLANVLSERHDMQLLKEGINMLGIAVGSALMPSSEVPPELKKKLRKELKKLGKL